MKATKVCLVGLVIGIVSLSASATLVQTNSSSYGSQSAFPAATDDLINYDQPTLGSAGVTEGGITYGDAGNLINGTSEDYFGAGYDGGTWQVTVTLNTTTNTLGYDITSMTSLAGWNDSRANQTITVEYSLVGSDDFVTLGTFTNDQAGGGDFSTRIVLTDDTGVIASGVDALRCTISQWNLIKEFDVVGSPTVPEPATMSLLAVGGALALIRRRR